MHINTEQIWNWLTLNPMVTTIIVVVIGLILLITLQDN